jgi:hypothetical protein
MDFLVVKIHIVFYSPFKSSIAEIPVKKQTWKIKSVLILTILQPGCNNFWEVREKEVEE